MAPEQGDQNNHRRGASVNQSNAPRPGAEACSRFDFRYLDAMPKDLRG